VHPTSTASPSVPQRQTQSTEDLGWALLGIPVAGTLLICGWVSNLTMFQGPGGATALVVAAVVITTAAIASIEADKLGMRTTRARSGQGGIAQRPASLSAVSTRSPTREIPTQPSREDAEAVYRYGKYEACTVALRFIHEVPTRVTAAKRTTTMDPPAIGAGCACDRWERRPFYMSSNRPYVGLNPRV
jgi:hypothetical protein